MERISLARTCLLLCCLAATRGDGETREPKVKVREGDDAVLPCSISPIQNLGGKRFDWKKDGGKEVFLYDNGDAYSNGRSGQDPQFTGRVSHFPEQLKDGDASIKIQRTTLADKGNYTCVFPDDNMQTSVIELLVECILKDRTKEKKDGACPTPTIHVKQSVLQCEIKGAFPKPDIKWQDSAGNILPAVVIKSTEEEGRFYITLQTTVTKFGRYICNVTQREICHQIQEETDLNNLGAAAELLATAVKTDEGVMLQCVARDVSPQTKVQWQDSSGKILPTKDRQVSQRGGSYDITLLAAVTKTDTFRCVITHPDNSQTSAETYAAGKADAGSNIWPWFGGLVLGALCLAIVLWLLRTMKRRKRGTLETQNGFALKTANGSAADGSHPTAEEPASEPLQPISDV